MRKGSFLSSDVDLVRLRYRVVDEALSTLSKLTEKTLNEIESDAKLGFALKGALLFYIQGLLDLANYVTIRRDLTPTNHREIFEILIRTKMLDGKYSDILNELVVLRNRLLFLYSKLELSEVYEFVKQNLGILNELYHLMIRLCGEM